MRKERNKHIVTASSKSSNTGFLETQHNSDNRYRLYGQGPIGPVYWADDNLPRLKRRGLLCKWWKIYDENGELLEAFPPGLVD